MITQKTKTYLNTKFKALATEAVRLNKIIKESKTDFKKQFYKKKLRKVGKQAADILVLLESSNPKNQQKEEENGNENRESSSN